MRTQKTAWKIVLPFVAIYAAVIFAGLYHHEIWLDEAHHWLLARDSSSLGDLICNARYDGHPLLWNFILYFLVRISADPVTMQIANGTIMVVAVLLFLRNAPFKPVISMLMMSGYFFIYEYAVISRNYSLIFLTLILVCTAYRRRNEKPLLFLLCLFLLSQTHLFATIIACVMLLQFILENVSSNRKTAILSVFTLLIAVCFVYFTAVPPPGHFLYHYDADAYFSFKRIGKAVSIMWKGLFPIPDFTSDHPWNSNFLIEHSRSIASFVAVLAWFIPLLFLWMRRMQVFFYLSALAIAGFVYCSPLIVAERHCGVLFLLLIAAKWMDTEHLTSEKLLPGKMLIRARFLTLRILYPLLLLVQLIAGVFLFRTDIKRPFSEAKNVAEWIKQHKLENEFIIVHDHTTGPAISAYLGKKVYYFENNAEESFCRWNTDPFLLDDDSIPYRLMRMKEYRDGKKIVLVSCRSLKALIPGSYCVNGGYDVQFTDGMVRAEEYYLYVLQKK